MAHLIDDFLQSEEAKKILKAWLGRCKNCKWFKPYFKSTFGECVNENVQARIDKPLCVRNDFGCIYWEKREEKKEE